MKKITKRVISIMMTIAMLFTMTGVTTAFAAGDDMADYYYELYIKKLDELTETINDLNSKIQNDENIPAEEKSRYQVQVDGIMKSFKEVEDFYNDKFYEAVVNYMNSSVRTSGYEVVEMGEEIIEKYTNEAIPTSIPESNATPTPITESAPESNTVPNTSSSLESQPSSTTNNFTHADYSDLPKDHWAYRDVMTLTETGAFTGYEDGTFRPDNTITHEEFLSSFIRLLGIPVTPVGDDYVQVETDDMTNPQYWTNRWAAWAQPYLNAALTTPYYVGEMDGSTFCFVRDKEIAMLNIDGTIQVSPPEFGLTAVQTPITRLEVARLLDDALSYRNEDFKLKDAQDVDVYHYNINQFDELFKSEYDKFTIDNSNYVSPSGEGIRIANDTYHSQVSYVVQLGIMSGYPDGTFKPEGNITRAEAAATLARLVNKDLRAECPWPPFGSGN